MRIGILSDTHDEIERTRVAVAMLRNAGAEALIHCGDLASPPIVHELAILPSWFVFGNHDSDMVPHLEKTAAASGVVCLGWEKRFRMASSRSHSLDWGQALVASIPIPVRCRFALQSNTSGSISSNFRSIGLKPRFVIRNSIPTEFVICSKSAPSRKAQIRTAFQLRAVNTKGNEIAFVREPLHDSSTESLMGEWAIRRQEVCQQVAHWSPFRA